MVFNRGKEFFMLKRVGVLLVGVSFLGGLLGCVSADAYRMKEQELQSLYSVNEDMGERNRSLRAEKAGLEARVEEMKKENEELEYRIEKQNSQIAFLKNWGETLEKDGDGLRARVEKLNAKIAELDKENQRLAFLSLPENLLSSLGDRLAELQKQAQVLAGENEKLKNRQVAFKSEEKKPSQAEGEKTIEAAGAKPQAVAVSSGQKAEDNESHKQQSERELRSSPGDRVTPFVMP
jgi:cell division protein FtsB